VSRECSTYRKERHWMFWWRHLKEREILGDIDRDGNIKLDRIIEK